MKNLEKIEKAFTHFKKGYAYKMGGTQTVILPNGKERKFDDREYYSGRGAKYNASIKHDNIGTVKVSKIDYSKFLAELKAREIRIAENKKKLAEAEARIKDAKERGEYSIIGDYVELSDEEAAGRYFDSNRLAKTLDISIEDARLLKSNGKTYVFAKRKSDGIVLELFHPSLSCNDLSIHISVATPERIVEFKHEEWSSAPFAGMVGQTENLNHFVC